jgi:hypothetical protein
VIYTSPQPAAPAARTTGTTGGGGAEGGSELQGRRNSSKAHACVCCCCSCSRGGERRSPLTAPGRWAVGTQVALSTIRITFRDPGHQ